MDAYTSWLLAQFGFPHPETPTFSFAGNPIAAATAGEGIAEAAARYDADLQWTDANSGQTETAFRLREGIERFLITDINNAAAGAVAQSEISVMFDNIATQVSTFNHIPGGANTLFMDGHVEFLRYATDFPATRAFASFIGTFGLP